MVNQGTNDLRGLGDQQRRILRRHSELSYSDYCSYAAVLVLIMRVRRKMRGVRVCMLPMLTMGTVPIESSPSHRKAWNVGININCLSSCSAISVSATDPLCRLFDTPQYDCQ